MGFVNVLHFFNVIDEIDEHDLSSLVDKVHDIAPRHVFLALEKVEGRLQSSSKARKSMHDTR